MKKNRLGLPDRKTDYRLSKQPQTDYAIRLFISGKMSCIDAAIIAEMNKQKTNDANSITTKSITCNGDLTATMLNGKLNSKYITIIENNTDAGESGSNISLYSWDGKLLAKHQSTGYKGTIWSASQTVTHATNVSGEIGTFCEATGEIYDGYDKIDNTDCICKVRSASALSSKVVGIITRDNEFASHGDVLVKVVPGSYNIGDILAPAENGYGRKATSEELQFMVLNSLPMVKITSINTGIANTVATFIR